MRVIGEIRHPACKISLFAWNQKYLVKFEQGMCEQTFKIDQLEVESEEALKERLTEPFIARVLERFKAMHEDLFELTE